MSSASSCLFLEPEPTAVRPAESRELFRERATMSPAPGSLIWEPTAVSPAESSELLPEQGPPPVVIGLFRHAESSELLREQGVSMASGCL